MSSDEATSRPVLRVISGSPTDEEIAAIIAVVQAQAAAAAAVRPEPEPEPSAWARPAFARASHPRNWRDSGLPKF